MSVKRFQCSPIFRRTPRFPGRNASPALRTVNSSLPSSPRTRRVPRFSPYPAGVYPQGTPVFRRPCGRLPAGYPRFGLTLRATPPPFPVGLPPLPYPNNFHPDSLTSLPTNLGHGSIHPHVAPLSPVTGGLASGSGSEKGRSEPGKGEKMRFWSKGGGFEPGMAKRNRGRPSFSTL